MSAWFYGHGTPACYEWLLKQTRKTEMARSKLPLNRPFALADQQKKDAAHIYSIDREDPSRIVYYPTGRPRRYRRIQLPRHRPGLQSQSPARMDPFR